MRKPLKFSVWFSLIITAVFVVAWLWIREYSKPGPYDLEPVIVVKHNKSNPTLGEIEDWLIYRDMKYKFEIKHPPELKFIHKYVYHPDRDSFIDSVSLSDGEPPNFPLVSLIIRAYVLTPAELQKAKQAYETNFDTINLVNNLTAYVNDKTYQANIFTDTMIFYFQVLEADGYGSLTVVSKKIPFRQILSTFKLLK